MDSLKIIRNDIQSINSKLLTQENTSTPILTRMETLSAEIISLKNENVESTKNIENLKTKFLDYICLLNATNDFPGFDLV